MIERTTLATLAAIVAMGPAHAAVTISTAATQDMDCSDGTCVPTATTAVLNAGDLESYLSQFGNVRVMTTGTGVEANNIVVAAAFVSPDSTSLTLDAHKAITINAAVSIGSGTSELELQSDTGGTLGTLSFGRKGHITFGSVSDIFGINGGIFTLVDSVQGLASAVAANPSGAYAFANSYDASHDGTYTQSPVQTDFAGIFEGLGNTISNLSIESVGWAALFWNVYGGTVTDVGLSKVAVAAHAGGAALAVLNYGSIIHAHATGRVKAQGGLDIDIGGLVMENDASISDSYSTVSVSGRKAFAAGGLVGVNIGSINGSLASGSVTSIGSSRHGTRYIGGLVGLNGYGESGSIANSYATGAASSVGGEGQCVGGLVGLNESGSISDSYSTGMVAGDNPGGFIGCNYSSVADGYWDTTSSGTEKGVGEGSAINITGLTTQEFQSGLPSGFSKKIWAEDAAINDGLPYLIDNLPPK